MEKYYLMSHSCFYSSTQDEDLILLHGTQGLLKAVLYYLSILSFCHSTPHFPASIPLTGMQGVIQLITHRKFQDHLKWHQLLAVNLPHSSHI